MDGQAALEPDRASTGEAEGFGQAHDPSQGEHGSRFLTVVSEG